jgi:ketosteroid isomerase-like protein
MTDLEIPEAIREFVEATNSGDTRRFVAAFTDDAYLSDWGREFRGHDRIREWDRTDNIGKRSHFDILGIESGDAPESYIVTMKVTGNGFNGTSPLNFILRDALIAELRIS